MMVSPGSQLPDTPALLHNVRCCALCASERSLRTPALLAASYKLTFSYMQLALSELFASLLREEDDATTVQTRSCRCNCSYGVYESHHSCENISAFDSVVISSSSVSHDPWNPR